VNQELNAARSRARELFTRFGTVLGVGVGPKLTGGRVVASNAIVVLVGRKLPARQVPRGEVIPPVFEGFPTDVREPVLTVQSPRRPEKGRPHGPAEWCLTGDARWIEWEKIHELNLAQQRSAPPSRRPRTSTRRRRGSNN
jgi:hypothetical protein